MTKPLTKITQLVGTAGTVHCDPGVHAADSIVSTPIEAWRTRPPELSLGTGGQWDTEFQQRLYAKDLSRWELVDLLDIRFPTAAPAGGCISGKIAYKRSNP